VIVPSDGWDGEKMERENAGAGDELITGCWESSKRCTTTTSPFAKIFTYRWEANAIAAKAPGLPSRKCAGHDATTQAKKAALKSGPTSNEKLNQNYLAKINLQPW